MIRELGGISSSKQRDPPRVIQDGKLFIKKMKSSVCYNMGGPRGYYAKWNKSETEKDKYHDFMYIWNLKKQNK